MITPLCRTGDRDRDARTPAPAFAAVSGNRGGRASGATRRSAHPAARTSEATTDMELSERQLERFWDRIDKTNDCWIWRGPRARGGYGKCQINGKTIRAHRLAYTLLVGEIPIDLLVMHGCDNRLCVNPAHLSVGTHQDNLDDAIAKGRWRYEAHGKGLRKPGEINEKAKLSTKDVVAIRDRSTNGETNAHLASDFGVSIKCIWAITTGRSWRHVR